MKKGKSSVKLNIIYGLMALVPVALIALLAMQLVSALSKLGKSLGLQSLWGVLAAVFLGLLALALICYFIGVMVRTKIGAWSFDRLEGKFFKQIPGYLLVKNLLTGFAEKRLAYPAALVRLQENSAAVFGLVMERHPDNRSTVFIPLAPMASLGSVYVVSDDNITMLEAKSLDVIGCVSQWGLGSQRVLNPGDHPSTPGITT
jgi:uncharacterized membrane protein